MAVERRLIGPQFLDVNEAGVEHVLRVPIFDAAFLTAAGVDHALPGGAGCVHIGRRQADGAYDQQHALP